MRRSGRALGRGADALRIAAIHVFGERIPAAAASFYGPRGLRFLLNVATALLVVSLPFAAAAQTTSAAAPAATEATTFVSVPSTAAVEDANARATSASRGLVAGSRSVVTAAAQDVRPLDSYTVESGDVLGKIAEKYQVSVDDLAFANGLEDDSLHVGAQLLIPPGRGALYYVKAGDTVEGVAQKFKVDPSAIMTYNRLYFEPEHFAPDQLIFVPGADVPAIKRTVFGPPIVVNSGQLPPRTGRLGWPVNGVITQYFWWGHTGVDIAAPYGTTIGASDDGVVVATGWVAVGGLRVCVQHSGGLQTCYYHTGAVFVSPGQTVARGQALASIGMTGVTTGPHVHWELKVNGVAVNPLGY
jgi:murein DD-endopeptidase MepM/ murein hydrolase activator NlpD